MTWRRRLRGLHRAEDGAVAGAEGVLFGVLVFFGGSLMLANIWAVIDAKMAVTSAAREAVRAFVEAPADPAADPAQLAREAAAATLRAYGRTSAPTFDPPPPDTFARCERVRIGVVTEVVVVIPFAGGAGPPLEVRSTATEIVDPLRSGVPGEASCV